MRFEVRDMDDNVLVQGPIKQKLTGDLEITLRGKGCVRQAGVPQDLWVLDRHGNTRLYNKWEDIGGSRPLVVGEFESFNIKIPVNRPDLKFLHAETHEN